MCSHGLHRVAAVILGESVARCVSRTVRTAQAACAGGAVVVVVVAVVVVVPPLSHCASFCILSLQPTTHDG